MSLAPRTRLERVTFRLGGGRSIQLSYRGGLTFNRLRDSKNQSYLVHWSVARAFTASCGLPQSLPFRSPILSRKARTWLELTTVGSPRRGVPHANCDLHHALLSVDSNKVTFHVFYKVRWLDEMKGFKLAGRVSHQ